MEILIGNRGALITGRRTGFSDPNQKYRHGGQGIGSQAETTAAGGLWYSQSHPEASLLAAGAVGKSNKCKIEGPVAGTWVFRWGPHK